MLSMAKRLVHAMGGWYVRTQCRNEFQRQEFVRVNERPIEYAYVMRWLNQLQPAKVLDVGVGTSPLPALLRTCGFLVTATDNVTDYWPSGMFNRHFHVVDDDITQSRLTETFDVVLCISTLEHIPNHGAATRHLFHRVKHGGHLIMTFPYHETSYVRNVYDLPDALYGRGNPYICQSYSRAELSTWLADNSGQIVDQEYWQCFTGKHWTQGQLVRPPRQTSSDEPHQLTCLVIRRSAPEPLKDASTAT